MHELAVCQALLAEVDSVAARRGTPLVTDIYVGIGPLSGVEADLLRDAFPIAAAGTLADMARLHIHRTPVMVRCSECGMETTVRANRLLCGDCGDWRTTLTSGDELFLERVVMEARSDERNTGEIVNV